MRNELINLITVVGYEKDSGGFNKSEKTVVTDNIFADVKSVGRTEFYEALRSKMRVDIIFDISPDDFEMAVVKTEKGKKKPSRVEYDGTQYMIVRTYKTDKDSLEMTCREVE